MNYWPLLYHGFTCTHAVAHRRLPLYVWSFRLPSILCLDGSLLILLPLAADLSGRLSRLALLLFLGTPKSLRLELVPVSLDIGQPATC